MFHYQQPYGQIPMNMNGRQFGGPGSGGGFTPPPPSFGGGGFAPPPPPFGGGGGGSTPGGFFPPSPPPSPGGGGFDGGDPYGAPTSPPPAFTPQQNVSTFAVDPGAIRRCRFRFTYIWLNNGNNFWFYPTFVGRDSIAGFRWRNNRWVYYGTDLQRIRSFQCGGF